MQRDVRLRRLCSSLEALAVLFGHAELDGGCRCCRWRVGLLLVEMRKAAPAREHWSVRPRRLAPRESTNFWLLQLLESTHVLGQKTRGLDS